MTTDDKFCKKCGSPLIASEALCKNCETELLDDATFCHQCGEEIALIPLIEPDTHNDDILTSLNESYAGFWLRFGAFAIDYSLIFIMFFMIGILIGSFDFLYENLFFLFDESIEAIVGLSGIILYHSFFLSIISSTPGKKLLGLTVKSDLYKGKLIVSTSFLRSISYLLSSLIIGLGFLSVAFNKPEHKAWHDSIAKTYVVRDLNKNITLGVIVAIIATIISWGILAG